MKTETNLIPSLRFPEFKNEWIPQELNQFISERNMESEENLPLYSLTIESGIVPKSKRYERSFLVKSEEDAYKVMLKDDFAFNPMNLRFGALARHKSNEKILVSKYYNIFFCNDKADPGFTEYYLTTYKMLQFYNRMATGSLEEKKRVHYLDFVNFNIPFPTLPEQQKIAAFLNAIEKKIQHLVKEKDLLEKYKKGIIKKVFDQEIQFKDKNGNNFPVWEEKKIEEVIKLGKQKYNPELNKTSYKCIELENLDQGTGRLLGYFDSTNQKSIKNVFRKGDILFGKLRPYLKKFWKADFDGVCSSEIWVLSSKTEQYSNDYLYYLIQTDAFMENANISSGSKMPRADWNLVANYFIPVSSSLEEQIKIADFLSRLDKKIDLANQQLEKTREYKKSLLQKIFV